MRKYKHLTIPDREPRNSDHISDKQSIYCMKSSCNKFCSICLFDQSNIKEFTEWYLAKNKPLTPKQE